MKLLIKEESTMRETFENFIWSKRSVFLATSLETRLNIKILITVQVWKAASALRFHRLFPGSA